MYLMALPFYQKERTDIVHVRTRHKFDNNITMLPGTKSSSSFDDYCAHQSDKLTVS